MIIEVVVDRNEHMTMKYAIKNATKKQAIINIDETILNITDLDAATQCDALRNEIRNTRVRPIYVRKHNKIFFFKTK